MTDLERWEKDTIAKQPVFDDRESAIRYSLEKYDEGNDFPAVFQEPGNGKFLAATYQAFELLLRKGYTMTAGFADLMRLHKQRNQT